MERVTGLPLRSPVSPPPGKRYHVCCKPQCVGEDAKKGIFKGVFITGIRKNCSKTCEYVNYLTGVRLITATRGSTASHLDTTHVPLPRGELKSQGRKRGED